MMTSMRRLRSRPCSVSLFAIGCVCMVLLLALLYRTRLGLADRPEQFDYTWTGLGRFVEARRARRDP